MYIQKKTKSSGEISGLPIDVRNEWRSNQQSLQKGFVALIAICWPMFITRHRTDIILLFVLFFLFSLRHSDHPVSLTSLYHFLSRYSASSSFPSTQDPRVTQAGNSPVSKHCNTSNACSPQSNLPVNNILTPTTQWMTAADAWWKHPIRPRIVRSCCLGYMQIDFGVHLLRTNVISVRR